MNNLKQLTWEVHQKAERTKFARGLIKGLSPVDYYRYLLNQYEIYSSLESIAESIISEFPNLERSKKIKQDLEELEVTYSFDYDPTLICPVVEEYKNHISNLEKNQLMAHIYVRHFGDMYGGQIIKKRNPGLGTMYDFDDVENLKSSIRERLDESLASEAETCFNFAIQLFEELTGERSLEHINTNTK